MIILLARAGAFSLALALAACSAARQAPPDAAADKAFKVVTTFLPITLFTRAVAGDCATVTALIPPSLGPHDFQAKPGDLTALRQAGVLVKNGLEMEGFLGKLVAAAENPQLVVIDSSRGVATLESAEHGDDHGHDHGHDHGAVNPHIWLDPLRAVQQVATIRDGLIQADPSCADGYRRNAAAFTAQLKQLNSEIASQLEPYRGKTFVAFHDFAPYFAQRYGLKADYLVDVPELNPAPADLQRVAAEVKSSQLKALLSEPQEGNRSFNTLAKDLGVKVVVFDPMETATEEASRNPATYVSVMRRNVADLRQAFGQ
ncbi:zinc ABC transporter substrate-binding protein [Cyanobium sp. A1C-AMD]|uniref:metal ABC transporter solute-binding protein, Zn/Mn family n=1 Tax=Cyanobium sp. A1C-AMD TaxID=2823694 RepID=UPI0020CE9B83|nr:zinc ABC transporter substrate-binding protein [Cyanobium sp. A1C-AMD]MCP9879810.1 zinc ABC transporter substrate-binding protein [Cyanobium sp. A1C-AMD]